MRHGEKEIEIWKTGFATVTERDEMRRRHRDARDKPRAARMVNSSANSFESDISKEGKVFFQSPRLRVHFPASTLIIDRRRKLYPVHFVSVQSDAPISVDERKCH